MSHKDQYSNIKNTEKSVCSDKHKETSIPLFEGTETNTKNEEKQKRLKKRQDKKEARLRKRQEKLKLKISKMSCKQYDNYENRRKIIEEKRTYLNTLSKEEKKKYRQKQKEIKHRKKLERSAQKKEIVKKPRVKQSKFNDKTSRKSFFRDKLKNMTAAEKRAFRSKKVDEARVKKQYYKYVSENWSDEIPLNIDYLLVDGNNLRGGGPNRKRRNDVIRHVSKVVIKSPQLANTKVICVFDGNASNCDRMDNVDVQFSENRIADDIIINLIREMPKNKKKLVITCDRMLAFRTLQLDNGHAMRNKYFTSIANGFTFRR